MSAAEVLAVLEAARAKIAEPQHWTMGAFARDDNGIEVPSMSSLAARWCALGAVRAAAAPWQALQSSSCEALQGAAETLHPGLVINSPAVWVNDALGHAAVLAMYDTAIARVRREALADNVLLAEVDGGSR